VAYRLIANRKGITSLADLKGKKIGTFPSTSAAYFVEKLLASAGLKTSDYSVVSGSVCSAAPCGAGTLPYMLQHGSIDAIGMWEPTVQLAIDAIGESNLAVFQNKTIYREIFNLHTTATKLKDAATRKSIVAFLKALNQAENIYNTDPSSILSQVSAAVGVSVAVLKEVWPVHTFNGTFLAPDMLDFMVQEDAWVAQQDRRTAMTKAELTNLIDPSVLAEALTS
jgi:ABC-type nitrate/sulfonate/bicarbonate transport system substrate-binding protein